MADKGLGRGFDVLMPADFDSSLLMDSDERVQKLLVSDIEPNPEQPRRHFEPESLEQLAQSIKRYGILQPLILSPAKNGKYRIVAGERRWRAAQLAKIRTVPAIVRERKQLEELEVALIENVQRVDLSPLEQAVSIERLHQQFNLSYKQIAERLAKAETTVSNLVRLLQLPPDAREALIHNEITEGHARAILALRAQPPKQAVLLQQIKAHGWSVRQAEQFVVANRDGAKNEQTVKVRMATETEETKRVSSIIQTPVSLRRTAKGGRLELHFKNDDELQRLLKLLETLNSNS